MNPTPYLRDIPLDQAIQRFHQELSANGLLQVLGEEDIPLSDEVVGRVLTSEALALRCSPHYHASAMDGFAVRSADTSNAQPTMPVMLAVGKSCVYVDTGDPIPDWADAVIPIENVESISDNGDILEDEIRSPAAIRIRAGVSPWSHVRPVGEDLITGQLILPQREKLRSVDIGALAAGGVTHLRVGRKPLIAILPTGDELVPLESVPGKGELSEFNSIMMAAQIREWGGIPRRYDITKDHLPKLIEMISMAARENDLVLVNAGSSAGKEDFTSRAIEELGRVIVHGIAVRPGHPVIIGFINLDEGMNPQRVPVIGVPGYPVSAAMTMEILVKPLILTWLGLTDPQPDEIEATLSRKITSPAGDDDYVRVVLGRVKGKLLAAPLSRGAGVTSSLSKADGILVIPRMIQGLEADEKVRVQMSRSIDQIEKNLLTIGSHDLTLDLLANALTKFDRRLVSSNVGSLGGLLALKKGECHFSGSHLLDAETGTYNTRDIQRVLPNHRLTILRWVRREQGLILRKGNPRGINTLMDLLRDDVTFMNRQRGAGTRILLDFNLDKLGIDPEKIKGYSQEEYTHLGVAVAVASGRADCGLGIAASAHVLDLDFIPLFLEEYELLFPAGAENDPFAQPVFILANELEFKEKVRKMPGYDIAFMGEIRFNGNA